MTDPGRYRRRFLPAALVVLALLLAAASVYYWRRSPPYQPLDKTFDGSSESLQRTVIVPTLDTPLPAGKSALWCSSFEIAWKRLRTEVLQGPIRIAGAEKLVERLDRAVGSHADLEPGSYYATAGRVEDGIVERIRREMKERFPDVPAADLPAGSGAASVAYAYLKGAVDFKSPFLVNPGTWRFRDGAGTTHQVRSFGIPVANRDTRTLGEQVEVVYAGYTPDERDVSEFVLDLCRYSRPNQLLLARIDRKETLQENLADVQRKMDQYPKDEREHALDPNDTLLIPFLNFRMSHNFKELEGHRPPLAALQVIDFQLDPRGARVASGASVEVKSRSPRKFHFDRPFLICLKKRGAARPFFVMWVDNAELLLQD
jgi:hypothetical protein